MALSHSQIQALLNEARAVGFDGDELNALEESLLDRAAQLTGAERLDMALSLAPEDEAKAADAFLVAFEDQRTAAIKRGAAEIKAISDDEWERLINGV